MVFKQLLFFFGCFGVSIWLSTRVSKGLGFDEVVPENSYLVPFFQARTNLFALSSPVYGVIKAVDYAQVSH
jgi:hypothetical protein